MNTFQKPGAKPEDKKRAGHDEEIDNPVEAGKKAIDAHKAVSPGATKQKDEEDKEDAANWHSEG